MDIFEKIETLTAAEIVDVVDAVICRYERLFPDWEIMTLAIDRKEDRNVQIERCIEWLEKLKTSR